MKTMYRAELYLNRVVEVQIERETLQYVVECGPHARRSAKAGEYSSYHATREEAVEWIRKRMIAEITRHEEAIKQISCQLSRFEAEYGGAT